MSNPQHLLSLHDYERLARRRIAAAAWDFIAGGSDDQATLGRNRDAFQELALVPRVLAAIAEVDASTSVLGERIAAPIMVAPTAYHGLAHEDAELATARGAGAADIPYVVSTMSNRSLEEIAGVSSGPLWFQLYVYKDRSVSESLIRRAEASGYSALVLTVDVPRMGRREKDIRNGFTLPSHLTAGNFEPQRIDDLHSARGGASAIANHVATSFDSALGWDVVAWLKKRTDLPLVIKGIMHPADAHLAAEHGVDAIVVSNHGGRQLDGTEATIRALPDIVDAIRGRCEIYLDGGIRRGTDVLKALALGARAVLLGRPIYWGLAADGERGVAHLLGLLADEFKLALMLAGCANATSVPASLVRRANSARTRTGAVTKM